jgi:mono/diheme cytochrome c family protein
MTIEWIRGIGAVLVIAGVCASIAISCATTVSNRTGDSLDSSQYPPDIRDAYKVFAVRCSRCHTLARPLNARIRDPQQWVRYVARMRLNPASGINAKNGEIILRFLLYYMNQREKERGAFNEPDAVLTSAQPLADLPPLAADAGALQGATADNDARGDGQKVVSTGDGSELGTPKSETSATEASP